jgi:hypothetical protein
MPDYSRDSADLNNYSTDQLLLMRDIDAAVKTARAGRAASRDRDVELTEPDIASAIEWKLRNLGFVATVASSEHEHDENCKYLGNDLWNCGKVDNA